MMMVRRRIGQRRIARRRSAAVVRPMNFNAMGKTTTPVMATVTNAIPASVNRKVVP